MRQSFQVCALAVLLASCGPSVVEPEPPHFLWSTDPLSQQNPFPDERLIVNGKAELRNRWFVPFLVPRAANAGTARYFNALTVQAREHLEAFGTFGPTLIPASEALDPASVQGHVARLVKDGEGYRVLERSVAVEHLSEVLGRKGFTVPEGSPEFIFARPTIPLPGGAEGLLVVLRGPTTSAGSELGRGFEWAAANRSLIGPIAAALEVPEDEVLYAVPQRAVNVLPQFRTLSAWAKAHPPAVVIPPQGIVADEGTTTRPVGVWRSTDPNWASFSLWLNATYFSKPAVSVGTVVVGELQSRDLREDEVMRPEWLADPSLAPIVPLRFVLALPKGTPPPGGWPVVIAQHGVGGRNSPQVGYDNSFCLNLAEVFAKRGLGCIGIDAPKHGSRGVFSGFFSVGNLPALRDRFREMTFDLLQLEAAVATIDIDGDGQPDLSPKTRYFGNSLGAIFGSGFTPVSNTTTTAMLNVPGAGLSNLVVSRTLQDLVGLLIAAETGLGFDTLEYHASFPLFRAVSQPFFDLGDPINLAAGLDPSIAVLQQAGIGDHVIPNQASFDLAHALNLSFDASDPRHVFNLVDPSRFLPPSQLEDYDGHFVFFDIPRVREQALTFLESDGRTLTTP